MPMSRPSFFPVCRVVYGFTTAPRVPSSSSSLPGSLVRTTGRPRGYLGMVQSFNLPGLLRLGTVLRRPSLLFPHLSVEHIGHLDFKALSAAGVKGIIYDKDNTLTAPYVDDIHPVVATAFKDSKEAFGDRMVILSNSAGTPDDPGHEAAARIESNLGVHVLRHVTKKPGRIPEVMEYFQGVREDELCVIGDRLMTDVLYGNLHGMLTVHTKILTTAGDNKAAAVVRRLEGGALRLLRKSRRVNPSPHPLLRGISVSSLIIEPSGQPPGNKQ